MFKKNNLSLSFLVISFFLLSYVIYRSEFYYDGQNRDYYIIYYLIILGLILFSLITFFLNRKIRTYLVIIISSCLFAIYMFETYYNYLVFKNTLNINNLTTKKKNSIIYKNLTGNEFDFRSKLEVYKDLKLKKKRIAVTIGSKLYDVGSEKILTFSGVSFAKTIMCNENGYYSIYDSDRFGFNNPDDQWDQDLDFLLIGDSFVNGACVNRPNDIGSNLRKFNLNGLNLGVVGNGPLSNLAVLREYYLQSKNIIFFFYEGNDLKNLKNEINDKYLSNYLIDKNFYQNLRSKQRIIDDMTIERINKELVKDNKKSEIDYYELILKTLKLYNFRKLIFGSQEPTFEKIIISIKNFAELNGSNFYFVYLPDYYTVKTNFKGVDYFRIKKLLKKLNIKFIDINEKVFQKELNPVIYFPFEQNGHYNEEGYKKIADAIYETIFKK